MKMASGPHLTVARRCLSVATDASDAVGVNAMISNGRTRGCRRSDGRYCAASVAPENYPVRFLTALFDYGLINRSCGRPWLRAEHTIVFVLQAGGACYSWRLPPPRRLGGLWLRRSSQEDCARLRRSFVRGIVLTPRRS
jgi:hypothetical protein